MPTAAIYTLGCRLNQADAALLADSLRAAGFALVRWGEAADLLVVNSCTVTASAAQKTRQAARAARRAHPQAFVALVGCEANIDRSGWPAAAGVDLVVANPDKLSLVERLPAWLGGAGGERRAAVAVAVEGEGFVQAGAGHYPHSTRANLKIQEGCDGRCTYCVVPRARGPARSRDWDDSLREAAELRRRGHREIVLTGVNIMLYESAGRRLPELLVALLRLGPDFRLRLGSTEPCAELPRLIELMAGEPRLCRFLHLPIQHGEDGMLAAMGRPYRVAEFAAAVGQAVVAVPGLCLGSDVIVGFPGETEAVFEQCAATLAGLPLAYLHVFRYSPRPGTPAARLAGQVAAELARERHRRLTEVGRKLAGAFAESQVGKRLEVLTENRNAGGNREGWSDNYLRVEIVDSAALPANALVEVQVEQVVEARHVRGRLG